MRWLTRKRIEKVLRAPLTVEGACWLAPSERVCRNGVHPVRRYVYEAVIGPVPAGQLVLARCGRKRCVRPDHLEVLTRRELILRTDCAAGVNARKRSCPRGHPLDDENAYRYPSGKRRCRRCHAEAERRRRSRAVRQAA